MSLKNDYPVPSTALKTGLAQLKQRQSKLTTLTVLSCVLLISTSLSLFIQQDVVFHFLGLTQNISQLHIPVSVDQNLQAYIDHPNYLFNLLSWFGWLLLKMTISFIGAFFVVGFLKKFRFFLVRFQSFILKFVAWLIAFAVLWSGLTYVQYDLKDDEDKELKSFIKYDQNIQQSDIYQYLQRSDAPETVQSYLLAQTALMHKPVDKVVATVYTEKLIKAEQSDSRFLEYGFKPEQLWTIQHQVFNRALSPIAQGVEAQVSRASFWSNIVEKVLWGISALSLFFSLMIYWVASRIAKRLHRIGHRIG